MSGRRKTCPGVLTVLLAAFLVVGNPYPALARPSCFGEPATLVGTPGRDTLIGTPAADVIVGRTGADIIKGRGGRDLICAGLGPGGWSRKKRDRLVETVYGGQGADQIRGAGDFEESFGGPGNDVISSGADGGDAFGNAGRDLIKGGPGGEQLIGGAGADRVYGRGGLDVMGQIATSWWGRALYVQPNGIGEPGDDLYEGGRDSDFLVLGPGDDTLDGGPGQDDVTYFSGRSRYSLSVNLKRGLATGLGSDTIEDVQDVTVTSGGPVRVRGDEQANQIFGGASIRSSSRTWFHGGGGDDLVWIRVDGTIGSEAPAMLRGGGGDDSLQGGATHARPRSPDVLEGGPGNDRLEGWAGTEVLRGGSGIDVLMGSVDEGTDELDGGPGEDWARFTDGDWVEANLTKGTFQEHYLVGSGAVGTLFRVENLVGTKHYFPLYSESHDTLIGDRHGNELVGRGGNDVIRGRGSDDLLKGGSEHDRIAGGRGEDRVSGGPGFDSCSGERIAWCEVEPPF